MPWVVKAWRVEAVAETYLDGLERLGAELTRSVQDHRRSLRGGCAPAPAGRARMRASPLAELFRATDEGLAASGPRFERTHPPSTSTTS